MAFWRRASSVVAALVAGVAAAAQTSSSTGVDWAFPTLSSPRPPTPDRFVNRLPPSPRRFTTAEVHDMSHAVDWYGERGPTVPTIAFQTGRPEAMACGYCHLPGGQGRPENASLAGLPADYIVEQVAAMRAGARTGVRPDWPPTALMHAVAAETSPGDVRAAAGWFSARRFHSHARVVEAATTPQAVAEAGVYHFMKGAPREPLGARILEGPEDFDRFELRDDRVGYVAYVPVGAIARGARLAATGDAGRIQPCSSCHAAGLTGAIGPPLAGRSPTGLFRQLYSFKVGGRRSAESAPMRAVVANLTASDMIDLAAYAGSLKP